MTDASFAHGLVGVTLDGRYRLDAVLGEGGMGSVFRATQLAMDRKVAVKLLKPHLTSDEAALQRFAREARATMKVDSPHAVKILDFGVTPRRDYYMVLEYLDGRTVHRELEIDGPFAPSRVAHVARHALHALGAAHHQGLIHRDVKPDNLLLMRVGDDCDYTKILDFGVAKLMQGAAGDPAQLALTGKGMVFGTPAFMSPEQACGQALDGRSDLYSLAATMFVMLTGVTLFEGKTAIELLTHHARTAPPHLAAVRPDLAAYPELDRLLQRCLAKEPERRPDTAAAMAALLRELEPTLTRGAPVSRRPADVPLSPTPPPAMYTSSYFLALRDTDPAVALRADRATVNARASLSSNLPGAPAHSPRRLGLWLGGVAMASVLGLGIGVAVRGASRSTSISSSSSSSPGGAAQAPALSGRRTEPSTAPSPTEGPTAAPSPPSSPADATTAAQSPATAPSSPNTSSTTPAANAIAAVRSPRRSATAAAPLPGDGTASGPRSSAQARNAIVEEHLRHAEEALRTGNHLRQIAEADLALHEDPKSVRARYLVGDGLIKTGDVERGCEYLQPLKRHPMARDRAREAGCPGN